MKTSVTLRDGRTVEVRRRLLPGDAGRIIQFHGDVYDRECGFGTRFEGYVAVTVGEFAVRHTPDAPGERIWIASPPGTLDPVGCCALLDAGEGQAQFRWFLIRPDYRGTGLGRLLLEDSIAFARQSGYRRIFLYTSDFLLPAAALYQSCGFVLADRQRAEGWEVPFTEHKYVLDLTS